MKFVRKVIDANSLMSTMIVNSLVGMIPYSGMSLAKLREERLKKYETID